MENLLLQLWLNKNGAAATANRPVSPPPNDGAIPDANIPAT
jgi:hypothetical protein